MSRVFLLQLLLLPLISHSLTSDGLSLLALKSAITSDPTGVLSTWSDSDPTPCNWLGVRCASNNVISLSLSGRGFSGYLPSELGALVSLRRLSLSRNNFSLPIPSNLFNATSLLSLDLSHNSLSGPIPPQISSLSNLSSLDLSSNLLSGPLPLHLSDLPSLQGTLNLSYNLFSGRVPPSFGRFPLLLSLDLRYNNLTGKIPQVGSLLNQGPTAFAGNPSLCGFPLSTPCPPEAQDPHPTPNPSFPYNYTNTKPPIPEKSSDSVFSFSSVPLIVAVFVAVAAVVLSLWLAKRKWFYAHKKAEAEENQKDQAVVPAGEFGGGGHEKGKFVVLEEGFGLELEDLLRASAYVVGKSRSGIVYRVVVGGSSPVAVTRLSQGDDLGRREFESELEAVGRVHHPNIVRLRAYYYATDDKLLVSDFIRNGSLYTALLGAHSNKTPPMSWGSRLKIAQGAARGLAYIHECNPRKYVHGNIKSSKILLDEELQPYISGFGLHRLQSSGSTLSKSINHTGSIKRHHTSNLAFVFKGSEITSDSAYLAPEAQAGNKLTQKCDVYSFGIVLMEILTGQLSDGLPEKQGKDKGLEGVVRKVFQEERPLSEIIDPALVHEVEAKKQVLAAFHVALNCTELEPDLRPRMRTVCESLEAIKFQ